LAHRVISLPRGKWSASGAERTSLLYDRLAPKCITVAPMQKYETDDPQTAINELLDVVIDRRGFLLMSVPLFTADSPARA
jgi:hypothetical protein